MKYLKKNRQRFEKNKETYYDHVKKKRQQLKDDKFCCDCGSIVGQLDKTKHFKTKKHQTYIQQQNI